MTDDSKQVQWKKLDLSWPLFCSQLAATPATPVQDARVRIFHGDELVLAITPEGEELGFVSAST